ncbi:hypothetical protein [Kitasatospora sp. NPDC008115]|uniref:hypothetical protein n=1 Tax=Kitasatospora sp. NPDC008115 TaxID=3364022 RepID=UPI0036E82477
MDATRRPTPDEIEERFVALVEGRLTRDEADRWAARWVADDGVEWDDTSWWALGLLYGIDLPDGEHGAYLHDDEQLREWLVELRERRSADGGRPRENPAMRAVHRCDEAPVAVVGGFESAGDAASGPGPAVTVAVCESHREVGKAWLAGLRPAVWAVEGGEQRCGWVYDFREPEVVLRSHADAWLDRLSGLDLADYDDWAAYLSAAHERLCLLHGLEPGHRGGGGAVSWIGSALDERDLGGDLAAALYFLGHAEILAAMGKVIEGGGHCC